MLQVVPYSRTGSKLEMPGKREIRREWREAMSLHGHVLCHIYHGYVLLRSCLLIRMCIHSVVSAKLPTRCAPYPSHTLESACECKCMCVSMCVRIRIDMHVLHPQALIHRSACACLSFGGDKSHGHTVDWTHVQLTHP